MIKHYPNPVDNLTTKENLTYVELKSRLFTLSTNNQLTNNRLTTTNDSALVARTAKQSNKTTPYADKWCTYCKKRAHTYKGHTWQQCRRLKKDTDKRTSVDTQNHAFVTHAQTAVSLPYLYNWKFDTYASSHMTSDIGKFEALKPHHGIVTVSGNTPLQATGIGSVIINCLLPDGKINPLRLTEVLYVPSLNHNLFSWNSCRSKGYQWEAIDSHVYLYNRNTIILTAEFHGNLPYIIEATHHALVTFPSTKSYMYWHSALGHPSKLSEQSY